MKYEIDGNEVSQEKFTESTGVEIKAKWNSTMTDLPPFTTSYPSTWPNPAMDGDNILYFPGLSAHIEEALRGRKEMEGKTDYSEINLDLLDLMAERIAKNKHKYPKGNMQKPIDPQLLVQAAFRHIKKMMQPPKDDPETFKDHLAAVAVNMSALLTQITR